MERLPACGNSSIHRASGNHGRFDAKDFHPQETSTGCIGPILVFVKTDCFWNLNSWQKWLLFNSKLNSLISYSFIYRNKYGTLVVRVLYSPVISWPKWPWKICTKTKPLQPSVALSSVGISPFLLVHLVHCFSWSHSELKKKTTCSSDYQQDHHWFYPHSSSHYIPSGYRLQYKIQFNIISYHIIDKYNIHI